MRTVGPYVATPKSRMMQFIKLAHPIVPVIDRQEFRRRHIGRPCAALIVMNVIILWLYRHILIVIVRRLRDNRFVLLGRHLR
jgi:hypothetical protein